MTARHGTFCVGLTCLALLLGGCDRAEAERKAREEQVQAERQKTREHAARELAEYEAEKADCHRRYPNVVAITDLQELVPQGDPDVETGFLGHDQDELRLAARINAEFEYAAARTRAMLGRTARELASANSPETSEQPAPKLRPKPNNPPAFLLPLRHLTRPERLALCLQGAELGRR